MWLSALVLSGFALPPSAGDEACMRFLREQWIVGNATESVASGDLDGDGDLDLAVANSSNSNSVSVLLN